MVLRMGMRGLMAGAALTVASVGNAAGVVQSSIVDQVAINRSNGNYLFIHVTPGPPIPAGCNINGYWNFTLPLTDSTSQNIYPMLLAAQAAGKLVSIYGTGACSENSAVESLSSFSINN